MQMSKHQVKWCVGFKSVQNLIVITHTLIFIYTYIYENPQFCFVCLIHCTLLRDGSYLQKWYYQKLFSKKGCHEFDNIQVNGHLKIMKAISPKKFLYMLHFSVKMPSMYIYIYIYVCTINNSLSDIIITGNTLQTPLVKTPGQYIYKFVF